MQTSFVLDHLDKLARFEASSAPVLSLYLNTAPDNTGHSTHDVFLRKELRDRVSTFAERSPERASLEDDAARIGRYIERELKRSTRGLALFASAASGLFEPFQLDVPFDRNQLVVSDRPHLYPLARIEDQFPRYAAAVVNTNRARIFVFSAGTALVSSDVQNPKTKHHKVGGWSQARFQRHVDNMHLQHAKEVADRLDTIVTAEAIDRVVVAGDEVIVPLLKEQLPGHLTARLVDVLRLDIRSPEHEVLAVTLEALQRKDAETDESVVRDLIDECRAGGLAVVGVAPVLSALGKGQVDTLVITASPQQLKGADDTANELVTLARQTSASVRFIENERLLADAGGVGATLRYID